MGGASKVRRLQGDLCNCFGLCVVCVCVCCLCVCRGQRLSPREQVAQNLVETVASHAQQWNRVQSAVVEHQGVIAELQGQEMQLNSEISQQEARVIELEALLQARQLRDSSEMAKLSSTQAELELLQSLLLRTREEHAAACDEISAMQNSLAQSVVPLFNSLDTVKQEVYI